MNINFVNFAPFRQPYWSGRNFLIRTATAGGIRRVDLWSTIFVNELAVIVNLSQFLHFHRRLIKASMSLFTFKWQGKSL